MKERNKMFNYYKHNDVWTKYDNPDSQAAAISFPSVINDSAPHTFILEITNLDLVKYRLWNN